jgi:hypothetical protein
MPQYEPDVTEADVERILSRDYPPEVRDTIREMTRGVTVSEKPRVILACLKNAGGDLQKLRGQLGEANGYYREIIGEAEYPNYMKAWSRIDRLSAEEQERIIEKDKVQYLKWLDPDAI